MTTYGVDRSGGSTGSATVPAVDSIAWNDVVFLDSTDSPYTVTDDDRGKLLAIDCTGGAVTVNLPSIAGLANFPDNSWLIGIKKSDSSGNAVTINRNGTDTIDSGTSETLLSSGAGMTLVPDTDTSPDQWVAMEWGPSGGNFTIETFSGDNSDTTFELSQAPGTENNTFVFISGVYQQKSEYSISGTTLTFSAAPPTGTDNIQVVVGTTLTIGVPSDGTVTAAKIDESVGYMTTGDVKLTLKTAADTGWVLMNDGSIGNASSGATTRASADTEDLFTLLWTNTANAQCPVSSGRGASAAADFAANKTITLPRALGRALATYGAGSQTETGVDADVDIGNNELVVASNNSRWFTGMAVTFTLASGTVTGLTSGNTYYVIRMSTTRISLASNLANAQNGTEIDFTAKSSPVWTITHSFTARVLAETAGEETHALALNELTSHTHTISPTPLVNNIGQITVGGTVGGDGGGATAQATGGNNAMNNMEPTLFLNVMIKL
jgi:hypothetical protein